jgi:1-phosphatidylinositol phosphodiesterase
VFAFDYNGDRKQDLALYRPGSGAISIARSNGNGSFTAVYAQGAPGSGIAGYDLRAANDRIAPFDYNGDGKQDLVLYRPGAGAVFVARSNGNGTFTAVHAVGADGPGAPNGIAGYDLLSSADQIVPFDYDGDRKSDLFLYRPGRGAAWVAHWKRD